VGKKTYFLSDAHLGMHSIGKSIEREKLLVKWMNEIQDDASEIYLLGDIFDFWYEYKKVIPKGFSRFLGKLTELSDNGIKVYFFIGNHDVWSFDYLKTECGVEIIRKPIFVNLDGKNFYLAHGDGLGPGDKGYLILKWAFHNKILQWFFSRLHPDFSLSLGQMWSKNSRLAKGIYTKFEGKNEWLVQHAFEVLKDNEIDFFIFGHRHIPMHLKLNETSELICLGDWIVHFTYAVFDGEKIEVKQYKDPDRSKIMTTFDQKNGW